MSGEQSIRSAAALGGWRPANFAAGTSRRSASDATPALADTAAHDPFALLAATVGSARPEGSAAPDRCRKGLAHLFSTTPRARPLRALDDGTEFPAHAIRIETERLVLRVLRLEDFDDYFAIAGDPETFRYSHRGAMTSDEAWTRLLRQVGHWTMLGWGMFAIEEKATGRFVGEAGYGDFRRGLGADFDGVPEGGCTIARWAQGLGYATEAMEAALAWIEQRLGAPRTVCLVHHLHATSLRVAEKLGYRRFAKRSYRGLEAILLERVRTRTEI